MGEDVWIYMGYAWSSHHRTTATALFWDLEMKKQRPNMVKATQWRFIHRCAGFRLVFVASDDVPMKSFLGLNPGHRCHPKCPNGLRLENVALLMDPPSQEILIGFLGQTSRQFFKNPHETRLDLGTFIGNSQQLRDMSLQSKWPTKFWAALCFSLLWRFWKNLAPAFSSCCQLPIAMLTLSETKTCIRHRYTMLPPGSPKKSHHPGRAVTFSRWALTDFDDLQDLK